jgi:hypothetical protein
MSLPPDRSDAWELCLVSTNKLALMCWASRSNEAVAQQSRKESVLIALAVAFESIYDNAQ